MSQYERARKRTENRLIDAAVTCLLRQGYDHLTVKAIADEADVGRGTFYAYFENVDAALLAISRRYFETMQADIHAMMTQYESPEKEIRAWQAAFESATQLQPLIAIMSNPNASHLTESFQDTMIAGFQQSLATDAFMYPSWMNLPLDVMATFSAGAVFAVMRRWLAGELDYSAETMGRMVFKLLYHRPPD